MKNKLLLLVMILFTSFSFSQRNPNQTFLTSFVYEAKEGMTDKFENAAAKKQKCITAMKEILFGPTEF